MANELHLSHVTVSLLYMGLQLLISLVFIYLIPATALVHWIYLCGRDYAPVPGVCVVHEEVLPSA